MERQPDCGMIMRHKKRNERTDAICPYISRPYTFGTWNYVERAVGERITLPPVAPTPHPSLSKSCQAVRAGRCYLPLLHEIDF